MIFIAFRRHSQILIVLLALAVLPQITACSYSYHVYQADDLSEGSPRVGIRTRWVHASVSGASSPQ